MKSQIIICISYICFALLATKFVPVDLNAQTFSSTVVEFNDKEISVSKVSGGGRIANITNEVNRHCKKEYRFADNGVSVTVKYNSEEESVVRTFAHSVADMLRLTRKTLEPLDVTEIVVYLYKTDTVQTNYKYLSRGNVYPIVQIYKEPGQLNLECVEFTPLCEEIFSITPHELSHIALSPVIDKESNKRWFDEGLAKYVESIVSARFAGAVNRRDLFNTFPVAALHRPATRNGLWDWKESTLNEAKNMDGWKARWETMAIYGASHQLLRLINENARIKDNVPPVNYLLRQMRSAARKNGFSSTEIEKLIVQDLKLKLRDLGILSPEQKEELAEKAINFLTGPYSNNADRRPEKFWSLSVLACISEGLSDTVLKTIAAILLDEKQDTIFRHLSATLLIINLQNRSIKISDAKMKLNITNVSSEAFESLLYEFSFTNEE